MNTRRLAALAFSLAVMITAMPAHLANAAAEDEQLEQVTVTASVDCGSEYPSGILITNPVTNARSFFVQSEIEDAAGRPQFGDGGLLHPGESVRVASSGDAVTVEDATYRYSVSQSPQTGGSDAPTEPFVLVASGTYEYDCETDVAYYVTKYDGTVWAVTAESIVALSYADWEAAGFPAPAPAPTDYVKYPWSSTISAVTIFGQESSRWVWRHVSLAEWNRAGRPAPRTAGWIKDSVYYQWEGSSQIFVQDVGGVKHALTYPEWQASGFQPFTKRANQGFVKLSWDGNIAFLHDFSNGHGAPIGYAQWQAEGFPHPAVATRFAGDQLYKYNGEQAIWYAGPTVNRTISYGEWGVMGYPSPSVRHILSQDGWNCPSWAPIKGNADSGIYHLPGWAYYDRTNPEECFRSEAAALGAGYRPSQVK